MIRLTPAASATRGEALTVGHEVLAADGNAVDAAVAMAFVLAVTEPYMTGPGAVGELLYMEPDGRCHVLDAGAHAPAGAQPDIYRVTGDPTGIYAWARVEYDRNMVGVLAATAPQLVAGLYRAQREFGRLPWPDLVRPAVRLAEGGVAVDFLLSAILTHEMPTLSRDAFARELYFPQGRPLPPPLLERRRITNRGLARTLHAVEREGPEALTTGPIATAILHGVESRGGLLSPTDLEVEPRLLRDVQPLARFRHWLVYGSPVASGGVTTAEILALIDVMGPRASAPTDVTRYERVATASRQAFHDRLTQMSGSHESSQVLRLLSPDRLRLLADQIEPARARANSERPSKKYESGAHTSMTATTHVSAADSDGGVAALTMSLLSLFGSQHWVADYGFPLNNGMLWFDPMPERPQSIAPGARALSAMAPLIVVDPEGSCRLAIGGLGNRPITTAVAQTVENVIDYGLRLNAAVNLPRIHADTLTTLRDERLATHGAHESLSELAPASVPYEPVSFTLARVNGVKVDSSTGETEVGIDLRSQSTWRFGAEGGDVG